MQDPVSCTAMADEAHREAQAERSASTYDARRRALESHGALPDETWTCSALVMCVENLLQSQPNIDAPFRSVAITMALARLGERGIATDWLVREQMGPGLVRRIIVAATSVWHRIRLGEIDHHHVPELHGWLSRIDQDAPENYETGRDRARLIMSALTGTTYTRGAAWLMDASIADISARRLNDYTRSPPEPDDLALPGGSAATRWFYERITRTYLSEWSPESWVWEASYQKHPSQVARRAGIPLPALEERTTTPDQLSIAASVFVLEDLGTILPGMARNEFVELVAHHLDRGEHDDARALSEAAFGERPGDVDVRSVHAFCWLPLAPRRSREIIDSTRVSRTMATAVRSINRATSFLAEENEAAALAEIASLTPEADGFDDAAWLWDPQDFAAAPTVIFVSPGQWIERAMAQLRN